MSTHRYTERTSFTGARVNRETGVITDVLLCGHTSQNGRDYPPDALRAAVQSYEGAKVNLNHGDASTVERLGGWISNVRYEAGSGVRGDFNALLQHPASGHLLEMAERNPSLVGFSHVAVCKTRRANGRDRIESISKVESVDVVVGPATTKGFFESTTQPGKPMKLTEYLAAIAAKFPESTKVVTLREMGDLMGDMPEDAPPVADAGSDADPIKAAFVTAMHGLVDQYDSGDLDDTAFMAKLKDVVKAHAKLAGKAEPAPVDAPADDAMPKEQAAKIAQLTVENMALRAGVTLTPVQQKALGLLTEEADRKSLIESFKAVIEAKGEKPVSGERNRHKPVGAADPSMPPADPVKFIEWLGAGR